MMKRLWHWMRRHIWRICKRRKYGKGISLLVPFRDCGDGHRTATLAWLKAYYRHALPSAQFIVAPDDGHNPFCKMMAFNNAARRARGDVFVLLDADCLIDTKVVLHCASRLREARRRGRHLWFVPFRRFYRLSEAYTHRILESNPRHPLFPPLFPDSSMLDEGCDTKFNYGHHYGALIQIMPREAWELLGGFDERFRSWGSDDVCIMQALDTLWGRHRTTPNPVFHLFHPFLGDRAYTRTWEGGISGQNDSLAGRYRAHLGNPEMMRKLVDEWKQK